MREIGIRELKASLSSTLRAVSGGEHVRVTARGKVVADIVPAGAPVGDERLHRLVRQGRLSPAGRSRPERAPRLERTRRPASEVVPAEREAER